MNCHCVWAKGWPQARIPEKLFFRIGQPIAIFKFFKKLVAAFITAEIVDLVTLPNRDGAVYFHIGATFRIRNHFATGCLFLEIDLFLPVFFLPESEKVIFKKTIEKIAKSHKNYKTEHETSLEPGC